MRVSASATASSAMSAPLTVTPDGSKSKTYGATFTAFTGTVGGLQNSDAATGAYSSTGATATAGAGSYNIVATGVNFTSGSASNYQTPTLNTATNGLTVNAAPLTVTPDGGKSKTYG